MSAMTYGNLALDSSFESERPYFQVIDGSKKAQVSTSTSTSFDADHGSHFAVLLGIFTLVIVLALPVITKEVSAQNTYTVALASTPQESIVVQMDDTLWTIAERYPVSGLSTSDTVYLIREWNDLDSGLLSIGEHLLVPAASHSK